MSQPTETIHEQYFSGDHVTRILPPRAFGAFDVRELWAYRDLLRAFARRHVQVRYRQTLLGIAWVLAQPCFQMLTFTVIFHRMANLPSGDAPYPLFAYTGLLVWNYFASSMSSAGSSLVSNGHLITKVYFPRLLLPLASALAGLLDLSVGALPLVGLMVYFERVPSSSVVVLPLVVACLVLVVAGVGSALSALTVRWRDLGHAVPFLLQLWFYATPVVYPRTLVPAALRFVVDWNPITAPTELFRAGVLGQAVDAVAALRALAVSIGVFALGTLIFHRFERRLADIV